MAYSELSALRIRDGLTASGTAHLTEKRMMGGLIFLINGNMLLGLKTLKSGAEQFMFRVGPEHEAEALAMGGARPMIHGARRMTGFMFVDDCDDAVFARLSGMARSYVETLPAK